MGKFEAAALAIEEGNASGGPLSAPGLVYLAATYQALGRVEDGQRLVRLLEKSWPNFPVEKGLLRLHRDRKTAHEVIDRLTALGWNRTSSAH